MESSTTQLSPEAKAFCLKLGEMIVRWNGIEAAVRLALYGAVDPPRPGHRIDVLTAHLGNVAIVESLTAIADDYDDPMRSHLKHCAKLFDAHRVYRNHFAHDPVAFAQNEDGSFVAITHSETSKGGALRRSQGDVTTNDLDAFHASLSTFHRYVSDIIGALWGIPEHTPLSSLEMPPLPDRLERHYQPIIVREPPP